MADTAEARAVGRDALGARHRARFLDALPVSIFLALLFTVAGLVELLTRTEVAKGFRPDDGLLLALTLGTTLTLALLWWSPFASLSAGTTLLCAQSVAGYLFTLAAIGAIVVASFSTVAFERGRLAVAGGFVVTSGVVVVFFTVAGVTWQIVAVTWVSLSVVWVVAGVLRLYRTSAARAERRAALFAADRDARAREAVAEERAHLARELHDSVGHALNVVVLHAGAATRVIDDKPELAREALASIETAGRQALCDIERMLGILRPPDEETALDAAPGLSGLGALCEQVREAGLPVELDVKGETRTLPASVDLTAYRIVQESLTNTIKHAGRTRAAVHVSFETDALVIEVLDEGRGVAAGGAGRGHGLLGMRERVLAFRGELTAGPRAEGGFAVRARLPLGTEGV
jgi:signal transduction histidine kinase